MKNELKWNANARYGRSPGKIMHAGDSFVFPDLAADCMKGSARISLDFIHCLF